MSYNHTHDLHPDVCIIGFKDSDENPEEKRVFMVLKLGLILGWCDIWGVSWGSLIVMDQFWEVCVCVWDQWTVLMSSAVDPWRSLLLIVFVPHSLTVSTCHTNGAAGRPLPFRSLFLSSFRYDWSVFYGSHDQRQASVRLTWLPTGLSRRSSCCTLLCFTLYLI